MRKTMTVVLAVALLGAAKHVPHGTIGLGVGAKSASEIVVKIDGHDVEMKLAGLPPNGTYQTQAFLDCLVAKRVLRVDRAAGRATMLDGTSVADHVAEFLLSKTPMDPCALGKAAYVGELPPLAGTKVTNAPNEPVATPGRGHASFGSGPGTQPAGGFTRSYGTTGQGVASPRANAPSPTMPAYSDTPTVYSPPVIGGSAPVIGTTTTMPSGSTTTIGTAGTYTPGQVQPYTPPPAGTTTIPSTSTNPP